MLSDSPSDLLRLLSKPAVYIDSTLAYEAHRHALLSIISGRNNAALLNGRSRTVLHRFHDLFNQKLFEGREGAGQIIYLESIHDDEINNVVGFLDEGKRVRPTEHRKRIPFTVRSIKGAGLVYTSPMKKDDRISVIKSIATAAGKGGEITTDPIKDKIGMMFVLMEDRVSPDQLVNQIVDVIKAGPKPVKRVDIDNKPDDQKRGQSPMFEFDARRIVWFENDPIPFELAVLNRKNYLNAVLEVGTRDPDTGLYMGMSHILFELRRLKQVMPILFPEEVYSLDLDPIFIQKSKSYARELRGRHKVIG